MERVAGIEPASSAWKAEVLPLYHTRMNPIASGGGGWIRTTEACASDLQSDPFGHSGTPPNFLLEWSWREESNPRPADYKSAALPTELRQQTAISSGCEF